MLNLVVELLVIQMYFRHKYVRTKLLINNIYAYTYKLYLRIFNHLRKKKFVTNSNKINQLSNINRQICYLDKRQISHTIFI